MSKESDQTLKTPISAKVLIKAAIQEVFDHIATADGLDKWFTSGSVIEEKVNGDMEFKWVDWGPDKVNTSSKCRVVWHERPNRFIFEWWLDHPTTVEIKLTETAHGTLLEVEEKGYEYSDEGVKRCLDCATGWGEAITLLKVYLEHGISYK